MNKSGNAAERGKDMEALPYNVTKLEEKLGYKFKNIELLQNAMTHSSYSNELKARRIYSESNERLEFLGDAVLEIVVSEYLYENYKEFPEGQLTKLRASVVCEKALASYSERIELCNYLKLGHGEEINSGRSNKSMLADAFEATLAAMFLDAGENGKKTVSDFVLPFIKKELSEVLSTGNTGDYKSQLQQFIQQTECDNIDYVLVNTSGPDHCREFTIEARLGSNVIGIGTGKRKGIAEQLAAKQALILFGQISESGSEERK